MKGEKAPAAGVVEMDRAKSEERRAKSEEAPAAGVVEMDRAKSEEAAAAGVEERKRNCEIID